MSAPVLDAPDSLSRLIPSRVARGFFLAVVSGLFFNFLNASAKELASEMPPLLRVVGALDSGHRPDRALHAVARRPEAACARAI